MFLSIFQLSFFILYDFPIIQENLAELADVSTALIGNLESEKISQGISVLTLWKISRILEISVDDLFNDTNSKKKSV